METYNLENEGRAISMNGPITPTTLQSTMKYLDHILLKGNEMVYINGLVVSRINNKDSLEIDALSLKTLLIEIINEMERIQYL